MEVVERLSIRVGFGRLRFDFGAVAAWAIPFVLILAVALNNGGYDIVERSEVGIALWWIVLIGTLFGALEAPSGSRVVRAAFALLLAYAAWTAVSLSWSGSDERTMIELGRISVFLAAFTLAITAQASARWRAVLGGVTAAVGAIVALAALSRLHPELFPAQTVGETFPGAGLEARLAYPLNYSSGVATLAALAAPLLLRAASEAKLIPFQALAAAALPIAMLTLWLTASSLAIPLLVVAIGSYLLLAPDRLPKLLTLLVAAAGGAILIAAVEQRSALDQGLTTPEAIAQGHGMFAVAMVVAIAVGLLQVGIGLAVRHGNRPRWLVISRRSAVITMASTAVMVVLGFALSPGPGAVGNVWDDFKGDSRVDPGESSRAAQILDPSNRGRIKFWESAIDAFETDPWRGIGPGNFEFWWAEHGNQAQFVRDAHSLYLENLAELGIPGALMISGFVLLVLIGGGISALRAAGDQRGAIAAATAAAAVFVLSSAVDWMWELGALSILFMVLAGVALNTRGAPPPRAPDHTNDILTRLPIAALAVAGLVVIAIPLGGAVAINRSQEQLGAGDPDAALASAEDANALQPYAATPDLQRALLFEEQGRVEDAVVAARSATQEERDNWRNWLTLSRIEAEAGNAESSLVAYREARRLNPRSSIFAK